MRRPLPISVQILEFDSNLFGFTVGRVDVDGLASSSAPETLAIASEWGIRLLYCESSKKLDLSPFSSDVLTKHVDKKTRFLKSVASTTQPASFVGGRIEKLLADKPSESLVDLALSSGEWSRFRLDEHIPKGVFEKLYQIWISRSVRGEIAESVLVARNVNDELLGMITVGQVDDRADIGLLAVGEIARGRGVGRALLAAAEEHARTLGRKLIQVVTQGNNTPACRIYEAAGYSVELESHVYHLWLPER
jgi:dTDP-4-amino-4,6-dideoxy-D-galactose acyltransferase